MPLPLKTLSEVSAELGIPESEIKALADMRKIRAVLKKARLMFAPDEIAKIKRLRKTLPESAKSSAGVAPSPPKPVAPPPRRSPPPRRTGS